MKKLYVVLITLITSCITYAQNVGIGTPTPLARFHVTDSSVLFSATGDIPATAEMPPLQGQGRRMMWYPNQAAFRVGYVTTDQWDQTNIGKYSFASGYSTIASGNISTALGYEAFATGHIATAIGFGAQASGLYSVAIGNNVAASGNSSIALGSSTAASGINSTAIGNYANATGDYSISMGYSTLASGSFSTAMGILTSASGTGSTTMGTNTFAIGDNTFAVGSGSTAAGHYSTVIGTNNFAGGSYSTALGESTTAESGYEIVLGRWNTDYVPSNTTDWIATDRLLVIGNGTGPGSRSDAMTVLKNGNTGIGTSNPGFPLSFPNTLGDKISLWGSSGSHYGFGIQGSLLQIHTDVPSSDISFGYGSSSSMTERMRILTNTGYDGMILNGRLVIKNGSSDPVGGGGGVWMYKADNTALLGFMGAQNNQNIGFYGGPANGGWGFAYDAINSRVGIGTSVPTTSLEVNGYTKSGSDAPAIKMKKVTGTTASIEGGFVVIAPGVDHLKILSVSMLVTGATFVAPPNLENTTIHYTWSINAAGNFIVSNILGQSANILSKPIKILITYEE